MADIAHNLSKFYRLLLRLCCFGLFIFNLITICVCFNLYKKIKFEKELKLRSIEKSAIKILTTKATVPSPVKIRLINAETMPANIKYCVLAGSPPCEPNTAKSFLSKSVNMRNAILENTINDASRYCMAGLRYTRLSVDSAIYETQVNVKTKSVANNIPKV
jgi:hypothetical protein